MSKVGDAHTFHKVRSPLLMPLTYDDTSVGSHRLFTLHLSQWASGSSRRKARRCFGSTRSPSPATLTLIIASCLHTRTLCRPSQSFDPHPATMPWLVARRTRAATWTSGCYTPGRR
eukprot:3938876-Rhodomonas_salina.2